MKHWTMWHARTHLKMLVPCLLVLPCLIFKYKKHTHTNSSCLIFLLIIFKSHSRDCVYSAPPSLPRFLSCTCSLGSEHFSSKSFSQTPCLVFSCSWFWGFHSKSFLQLYRSPSPILHSSSIPLTWPSHVNLTHFFVSQKPLFLSPASITFSRSSSVNSSWSVEKASILIVFHLESVVPILHFLLLLLLLRSYNGLQLCHHLHQWEPMFHCFFSSLSCCLSPLTHSFTIPLMPGESWHKAGFALDGLPVHGRAQAHTDSL